MGGGLRAQVWARANWRQTVSPRALSLSPLHPPSRALRREKLSKMITEGQQAVQKIRGDIIAAQQAEAEAGARGVF